VAVAIIQGLPPNGEIVNVVLLRCTLDAPVPVTFIILVPGGAVAAVVIVSVAVAEPPAAGVIEVGNIVPVTPNPGGTDTVSETGELKELMEPTEIVKVADEPFRTVEALGDTANEKSCGATMFKVTFVM
jgi:hypothetical protein